MSLQQKTETNLFWLLLFTVLTISVGALVEIVPLFYQKSTTEPVAGLKPYSALALAGRDIYQREGCMSCHSQMVRPFRAETERYGHYSVAGEFVYDHPFQWGSKRTGPDLARVGGRYSDDWHRVHMINPRDVVPESIMPGYPWLEGAPIDGEGIQKRMRVLRVLGLPYTDEEIDKAPQVLVGKTEMDGMIAYLQGLGIHVKVRR
ncbi:MAG: cytochrome-c oxidase, cbb3-type subunit II [Acidiferrobacteraceae bacterium]|jgi:cytochrome c oxidase cbb3-type subunit II|nr:cytochrome-c oxidase, cbb3-type subunit II [Acidiferrobacteraceae bacterium]MBT3639889.1 cytochrome-c oxidase, cbb3-type subunit II [Acidiferrobacteraceae bacterium]MBT3769195.1 cytochrome-c oxidase, cbb3-type subunit II [Acidiferrobacteraceae bacterium]MBT3974356.1 cytochrome-c oxidase, cbb3-type subunit II [Acidiferrobacteraceae bacterium]MBT4808120.1 cytochrome-c oxidase, cbb3-type subunit II [Acidiferrobacteraceae bacterium]